MHYAALLESVLLPDKASLDCCSVLCWKAGGEGPPMAICSTRSAGFAIILHQEEENTKLEALN